MLTRNRTVYADEYGAIGVSLLSTWTNEKFRSALRPFERQALNKKGHAVRRQGEGPN
jgi:hypothetical protein